MKSKEPESTKKNRYFIAKKTWEAVNSKELKGGGTVAVLFLEENYIEHEPLTYGGEEMIELEVKVKNEKG